MAIRIFYNYSQYNFRSDYNTPLTEHDYMQIQSNKQAFLDSKKSELNREFKQDQGLWRRMSFPVMVLFFLIGLTVPILAITKPTLTDQFENSDTFMSIFGVVMFLGIISISGGLGYYKSRKSFKKYRKQALDYYRSHVKDISTSNSYQDYVTTRSKWLKG